MGKKGLRRELLLKESLSGKIPQLKTLKGARPVGGDSAGSLKAT